MRSDMNHVLVDEPRSGRASARALAGTRRLLRGRLDPDGEGGPQRIGMRRDAIDRKHFGEHLSPLYRYLDKQVHRPWAKVYSELCTQLDRRSVVQAHLFQHIDDHVAIRTLLRDGEVWVHGQRWFDMQPLARSRTPLFVHPLTGMLLPNRVGAIERRRAAEQRAARREEQNADRRTAVGENVQWHRLEGLWFEVTLAPFESDGCDLQVFDIVLRRTVTARNRELLRTTYGRADRYGVSKKQLGRKALRERGLASG